MKMPKDTIVWFEIPVSNLDNAKKFYESVMQTELVKQEMGGGVSLIFPVEDMKTGVSGHLYEGKPATDNGTTIHFDAPVPLEESLERLVKAGGKIISEEVEIPSGKFVYCQDPDGNSISLFNRS